MNEYLLIIFGSSLLYLWARLLIADYFRHKEELIDRINIKVTKGQHDGQG
jgi:hypothetical protein